MIAKNFIQYPEALRFQREMFSSSYKNQPRIMRLMTVIFKQLPSVPAWVKEAAAAAKRLAKHWAAQQISINFKAAEIATMQRVNGFYYGPNGETWTGRGLVPKWLQQLVQWGHQRDEFKYVSH